MLNFERCMVVVMERVVKAHEMLNQASQDLMCERNS